MDKTNEVLRKAQAGDHGRAAWHDRCPQGDQPAHGELELQHSETAHGSGQTPGGLHQEDAGPDQNGLDLA